MKSKSRSLWLYLVLSMSKQQRCQRRCPTSYSTFFGVTRDMVDALTVNMPMTCAVFISGKRFRDGAISRCTYDTFEVCISLVLGRFCYPSLWYGVSSYAVLARPCYIACRASQVYRRPEPYRR